MAFSSRGNTDARAFIASTTVVMSCNST